MSEEQLPSPITATTTNREQWLHLTDHLPSPDIYREIAWLFTVNAALQRRVWIGNYELEALFPVLFIVLVGPPAVGKGATLGRVSDLVSYHKFRPKANQEVWDELHKNKELPLLLPNGPDATTYEGLLANMSQSNRMVEINLPGKSKPKREAQQNIVLILEEWKSLLRRTGKNTVQTTTSDFLLNVFDCKPYAYRPKHGPPDVLPNPSLSFIAGCVPEYIVEIANLGIFSDGLMSRTLLVFAEKPRPTRFFRKRITDTQLASRKVLLNRVKYLSTISGELSISPEAEEYMENWHARTYATELKYSHPQFQHYLGRRPVHLIKFACGIHFSDKDNFILDLDDFKKAIALLSEIEEPMRRHYHQYGSNPKMAQSGAVLRTIRDYNSAGLATIADYHGANLEIKEIEEILEFLVLTKKIRKTSKNGNIVYEEIKQDED